MSKSSVFVKDMGIPQRCGQCKLYHAEYPMYCMAVEGHRTVGAPYGMPRPDWCPLVEVKEPHGRLGDLDKLKAKFRHSEKDDEVDKAWNSAVRRIITQAETIIEPEGSKE